MKKQLSGHPIFWMILEFEALINNTTASHIARTAILSWITRVNQTRIPNFFRDEKLLSQFQETLEKYNRVFRNLKEDDQPPGVFLKDVDEAYKLIYAHCVDIFEKERSRLIKKSENLTRTASKPV